MHIVFSRSEQPRNHWDCTGQNPLAMRFMYHQSLVHQTGVFYRGSSSDQTSYPLAEANVDFVQRQYQYVTQSPERKRGQSTVPRFQTHCDDKNHTEIRIPRVPPGRCRIINLESPDLQLVHDTDILLHSSDPTSTPSCPAHRSG